MIIITMGLGAWPAYETIPTPSAPILFHLFPCQSWSAPRDPLGTCRSPLLARMIWAGSVHSSSCNSSTDSSKNSSQSRGQWWQTGSRGNRQNKTKQGWGVVGCGRTPEIKRAPMYLQRPEDIAVHPVDHIFILILIPCKNSLVSLETNSSQSFA